MAKAGYWLVWVGMIATLLAGCGCRSSSKEFLWSFQTDRPMFLAGPSQAWTPRIDGDTVFFCGGYLWNQASKLFALNLQDGHVKWEYSVGSCEASPILSGQSVLVFSSRLHGQQYFVQSLNKSSGQMQWKHQFDSRIAEPLLIGDYVYCSAQAGIVRVKISSGEVQSFDLPGYATSGRQAIWLTGTAESALFGYGKLVWTWKQEQELPQPSVPLGGLAGLPSSVGTDGRTLVLGDRKGSLLAFDLQNGELRWSFQWNQVLSMPLIVDGKLYINVWNGNYMLKAMDLTTGAELWAHPDGWFETPYYESGRIYNAGRYAGGPAALSVLDAKTGNVEAQFISPDEIIAGPVLGDGIILFGTIRGTLNAVPFK